MKKILQLIIVAITIFVTACTDDLNVNPTGTIVSSTFFKTIDDATAAVTGVYSSLSYWPDGISYYGCLHNYMADVASDYLTAGTHNSWPSLVACGTKRYNESNEYIYSAWCQTYNGINRANIAIDNIPNVSGDSITKTRLIGEAKFIRALFYFNAVRFWGPVPLVIHSPTTVSNITPARAPVDSVYAQIIRDLKDVASLPITNIVSDTKLGRATAGAAKALLAKVYLTRGDWGNAINYSRDLIQNRASYGYDLYTTYYDNFDPKKKNAKENIFSVQFELGQNGGTGTGSVLTHCYFSNYFTNSSTPFITLSDLKYYDLFSSSDQRRDISMEKNMYNPKTNSIFVFTVPRLRKFVDTTIVLTTTSKATSNYPVIRYSDVLLTFAEAVNERGGTSDPYAAEAAEAINEVRRRAYKYDIYTAGSSVDLSSGITQDQFRDSLRLERYKEFTQEGTRWFDLVRWKIYVKSINASPYQSSNPLRNYLFPIPQAERNVNPNITQNYGYSEGPTTSPYDVSYQ